MANVRTVKEDARMDITPMIDCVFLLLIFFVLVIDLSQKELEDLILPKAICAEPDDRPPKVRPVANILGCGSVCYRGTMYYNAAKDGDDCTGMENLVREWRRTLELTMKPTFEGKPVGPKNPLIPDDPVLLRADKWTPWRDVGRFMATCSQPYAAFWRVELAMSEVDKEVEMYAARARSSAANK